MLDLHDRVYGWLCKKSKGSSTGKLRCTGVLDKLRTDVVNDPVSLRKALIRLRTDGLIEYAAGQHGEPVSGFMTVIHPTEEVPHFVEAWMEKLASSALNDADKIALRPIGASLAGFSKHNMAVLLDGLIRLRDDQAAHYGQQVFNVSAAYLLGSSKLLLALDSRALQDFGIAVDRFSSRAPYVVVGGNISSPNAVVLVENPIPFETAIASPAAKWCLFVCTFGFGLSAAANDYGNQLAGIVENGRAVVLNRSGGAATTIDRVLSHSKVHFWGDLDIAGMQIYERIGRHVPALALSALYGPMIDAVVTNDLRHPYVAAVGKSGQSMFSAMREDSRPLLDYCREWAVDQELVTANQIEEFAGKPLVLGEDR